MRFIHHLSLVIGLLLAGTAFGATATGDSIADGRKLLDKGEADKALALFEAADQESGGAFATRMWVLRAWMEQGRVNDAMNALDALIETDNPPDTDVEYLRGIGLWHQGTGYIEQGVDGRTIGFTFHDATGYLSGVTKSDPQRYHDAFLPLAECAWYASQLDVARPAAEKAIELQPASARAHFQLGRVAFSQYSALREDETQKKTADRFLADAVKSFERAAKTLGNPDDDAGRRMMANIYLQSGYAHVWGGDKDAAAKAFASAIGWDPAAVDYGQLVGILSTEDSNAAFVSTLQDGEKQFQARFGKSHAGDATLLWWLGFGEFQSGSYEAAEASFSKSVEKWPAYVNAHYYIALSRYYRKEYPQAIEALRANWDVDPSSLVASVQSNRETNLQILDWLVGWSAQNEETQDAAFLCEVRTGVFPENWEYWDNLGLFARDAGQVLAEKSPQRAKELWEKALAAYGTARELAPAKPHLLNDRAVILHYYLERDLDEAKKLYEKAQAEAQALLENGGLEEYDEQVVKTALRDSKDNLEKLEEDMKGVGGGH